MSKKPWIRRVVAAVATTGALTLAFQPPAMATTIELPFRPALTQSRSDITKRISEFRKALYRIGDGARPSAPQPEPPANPDPGPAPQPEPPASPDPGPAPQPEPPANPNPAPDPVTPPTSDIATQIFELTNAERTRAGLDPLRRNDCLTRSAQQWSDQMSREKQMYHSELAPLLRSCDMRRVGENVARGGRSAEHTVQLWMDSPGHRANILNPDFSELGVGWASDGAFATQQFGGH